MLRKFLVTTASVVALVSAANAADIYRAPDGVSYKDGPYVASWAGFYAGVNGGYAWAASTDQFANAAISFNGFAPNGGFGGGQIGYNWQGVWHPHLVLGIEADIQGAGIEDNATSTGTRYDSKLDWFGTVRGRLGYGFDRTLIYATGGFAYGGVDNRVLFPGTLFSSNTTATGYVVGAGVEYKITPAWSVKFEYQYIDLGKNDPVTAGNVSYGSIGGTIVQEDVYHTARVGLNYHFGNGYAPLK